MQLSILKGSTLLLASSLLALASHGSHAIVGGMDADSGEFPYMVSIQGQFGHFCGGSVISENAVLTAAQCVFNAEPSDLTVVVDEHDLKDNTDNAIEVSVSEIVMYNENFDLYMSFEHDIAILFISNSLTFDSHEDKVFLPPHSEEPEQGEEDGFTGEHAIVSGWGTLHYGDVLLSHILQWVNVPIVSNEECKDDYGNSSYSDLITHYTLCADGTKKDACEGDSGGPLTYKNSQGNREQIGIVSWGMGCANGYPGVYTRVSAYRNWIDCVLQEGPDGNPDSCPTN